jgi:hypothetical protein
VRLILLLHRGSLREETRLMLRLLVIRGEDDLLLPKGSGRRGGRWSRRVMAVAPRSESGATRRCGEPGHRHHLREERRVDDGERSSDGAKRI